MMAERLAFGHNLPESVHHPSRCLRVTSPTRYLAGVCVCGLAIARGRVAVTIRPTAAVQARGAEVKAAELDRSPVELVLTADEKWLLTANQTADSVSLIDLTTGKVAAEVPCGRRPSAIVLTPNEQHVL